MELSQIGWIETCYQEKFGVPRQSGVVPEAWGIIRFCDDYRDPNFLKGLEGFSHLWVIFEFHQARSTKGKAMVRPPRLGGNEKLGVFATRTPFRPNALGLSVVEIDHIENNSESGSTIHVKGVDLVNGTPIYDIKPYIPYCDAIPDAKSGYVTGSPEVMTVEWGFEMGDSDLQTLIEQTLSVDPRPAYHDEPSREYGCTISGHNVRWVVEAETVKILSCVRV